MTDVGNTIYQSRLSVLLACTEDEDTKKRLKYWFSSYVQRLGVEHRVTHEDLKAMKIPRDDLFRAEKNIGGKLIAQAVEKSRDTLTAFEVRGTPEEGDVSFITTMMVLK